MKKILVIDNYDSFTYNLVYYLKILTNPINTKIDVYRNDEIEIENIKEYDKILLSPGPGIPSEAGICIDLVKQYASTKSILGVCLGHQVIGEVFGGKLINLDRVYHGIATPVKIVDRDEPLYKGLPITFEAGRYHSWIVDHKTLPNCLKITSVDENGFIMGMSHKQYDVRGLQFHPESVLTDYGLKIIENWLNI